MVRNECRDEYVRFVFANRSNVKCRFHGDTYPFRLTSTLVCEPIRNTAPGDTACHSNSVHIGCDLYFGGKNELTSCSANCDDWRLTCSTRWRKQGRTPIFSRITFDCNGTFVRVCDWAPALVGGHGSLNTTHAHTVHR